MDIIYIDAAAAHSLTLAEKIVHKIAHLTNPGFGNRTGIHGPEWNTHVIELGRAAGIRTRAAEDNARLSPERLDLNENHTSVGADKGSMKSTSGLVDVPARDTHNPESKGSKDATGSPGGSSGRDSGNGNSGHGYDIDHYGPQPFLLDLDNNGLSVTELAQSTHFVDGGDGLKHRTAWAAAGDGVLFFDVAGDGQINEKPARPFVTRSLFPSHSNFGKEAKPWRSPERYKYRILSDIGWH